MNCPKCGGIPYLLQYGSRADDIVLYRKFRCKTCEHIFYTAEIEIQYNERVAEILKRHRESVLVSEKMTNLTKWCKVRCVDTGEVFESITKAAKSVPITKQAIWMCCAGKRETAAGMRWEYYNEDEKENEV